MFDFKTSAKKSLTLCPIMLGREKLTTEEVAGRVLTVIGFDFAPKMDKNGGYIPLPNGEIDTFGVLVFEEMPDRYYSVGTIFSKVCHTWAEAFQNDAEVASEALKKQGGVKVKFTTSKTKSGNNLTVAEIVD